MPEQAYEAYAGETVYGVTLNEPPSPPMVDGAAMTWPFLLTMMTGCAVLVFRLTMTPFWVVCEPEKYAAWKLSKGICRVAE